MTMLPIQPAPDRGPSRPAAAGQLRATITSARAALAEGTALECASFERAAGRDGTRSGAGVNPHSALIGQTCLLALALLVCQSAYAKLNVVATTPDFGSIATVIGGSEVSVTTLAKPTEDPHFVDAKPSFILKLSRADAIIEGGADLEIGWLPALLDQARNTKLAPGAPGRIACSQGIQLLEVPATLDRSKGDIHVAGNPHYLTDPANAKIVAGHIAEAFSNLDPKSAAVFNANLKKFNEQLGAKLAEWQQLLDPFKNQQVVAYHDSWPYFAHRFNLKIDLFLEPKPGIPPTPLHLADVIVHMRSDHVRAILVEPYQNRKTAQTVAADTGATVVDASQFPGGVKGTDAGYVELMDYNIHALARALGGSKQAAVLNDQSSARK